MNDNPQKLPYIKPMLHTHEPLRNITTAFFDSPTVVSSAPTGCHWRELPPIDQAELAECVTVAE